jgi:uncharacterized metal-binding protein
MGATKVSLGSLDQQDALATMLAAGDTGRLERSVAIAMERRRLAEELARQTEAGAEASRKMAQRLSVVLHAGRVRRNSAWTCSRGTEPAPR